MKILLAKPNLIFFSSIESKKENLIRKNKQEFFITKKDSRFCIRVLKKDKQEGKIDNKMKWENRERIISKRFN